MYPESCTHNNFVVLHCGMPFKAQHTGWTDYAPLTRTGARYALQDALRRGGATAGEYVVLTYSHPGIVSSAHVFHVEQGLPPLKVVD